MPKDLAEGNQLFTFADVWDVEKYDGHADTKSFAGRISNRKAVDFVGLHSDTAYFVEIKDFRNYRIENKPKFNGQLQEDVAAKVYDTIAGLVLAHRNSPSVPIWRNALTRCRSATGNIRVVLWFEDSLFSRQADKRGKVAATVFTQKLKAALRWLPAAHVFIVNRSYNAGALPDVTVRDLPGAAGN